MFPHPDLPRPLQLTAGFLLVQGLLSLVGTLLSVVQHRLSIDLTLGSLLLGLGLLRLSRVARWLSLASLATQGAMCAWILYDVQMGIGAAGDGRLFAFLLWETSPEGLKGLMAVLLIVVTALFAYLARPATGRRFKTGRPGPGRRVP